MAELKRSEFEADFADTGYSNQRLAGGVYVGTKGAGLDWFAALVDMLASIDDRLVPLAGLRVYKDSTDGDLEFSVSAGVFRHHNRLVTFAGATNQALTDATTNYVYLSADGSLVVSTTGWPTSPHVRLATITPAAGAFDDPTQMVDQRVIHSTAGPPPQLAVDFQIGAESSDKIAVTLQVQDATGTDVAGVFDLLCWLADTQGSLDLTATPCTSWQATTGALNDSRLGMTARKEALVQTDANGTAVIEIEYTGGAKTWYLEAESAGVHNSSAAITFAA